MSLYNMLNGVTSATFFVLPMLGKHAEEYPRFRDCFIGDEERPEYDDHILVFTRTGGCNREYYEDSHEELRKIPEYVTDYDDDFDETYATFVFQVPEKWKADFELFKAGNVKDFSEEYKNEVRRAYPKLNDKLNELWGTVEA